jgi:hypothetical protein
MECIPQASVVRIVNNIAKVIKTSNIELLTKQAYNYLYLAQGFIAHYNLHGFRDYYQDTATLKDDILQFQDSNQWTNFHPGERDYEYMMQKRDIYNAICKAIA